jgi:hypothetical protein
MSAFIIGIGVALAAIGIVLTTNGLVIYQSTFGNAMATVGGIALVGGLVILALGFIYRLLLQISEKLDGVMLPYDAEEDAEGHAAETTHAHHAPIQPEPIQPAPLPRPLEALQRREAVHHEPVHHAPPPRPIPAAPVAPPKVAPLPMPSAAPPAPAPYVPPPQPRPAPVSLEPDISEPISEPESIPAPVSEPPRDHGLPSWFRRNREPVPPPPPVATRNFQLDEGDEPAEPRPGRGGYREEPREDDFPSVVKSGPFNFDLPERESEDLEFEPIIPRREMDEPAPTVREPVLREPSVREPAPREPSVREPVARPTAGEEESGPGLPPAFLRPGQAAAPTAPTVTPEARQPTVLKSGFIGGMAYTLYSDGSIEAELPDGVLRFGSLQELREHVAATSSQGGA